MKTVYLAGPISGCTYEGATGWRQAAIQLLRPYGVVGVSPMRDKDFLRGIGVISGHYDNDILSSAPGIMTRDRYDCTHADAVLFYLKGAERVSIGTMIEIGWADANRIPTVAVMEDGNIHEHPMVRQGLNLVVPTLNDAVSALGSILAPHAGILSAKEVQDA